MCSEIGLSQKARHLEDRPSPTNHFFFIFFFFFLGQSLLKKITGKIKKFRSCMFFFLRCRRHVSFDFLPCSRRTPRVRCESISPFSVYPRVPRKVSACAVARSTAGHGKIFTLRRGRHFFFRQEEKKLFFFLKEKKKMDFEAAFQSTEDETPRTWKPRTSTATRW